MWFCAAVLKVAEQNGQRQPNSLWEEQLFLLQADEEQAALREAEEIATRPEPPYRNRKGELISWQFVKVDRVFRIAEEDLRSGVEVFSRFLRDSEAKSLMTPFEDAET